MKYYFSSIPVGMEPAGRVSKDNTHLSRRWVGQEECSALQGRWQQQGVLAESWGKPLLHTPPRAVSPTSTLGNFLPTRVVGGHSMEAASSSRMWGCGAATSIVPYLATPRHLSLPLPVCLPTSVPTLTSSLTSTNSSLLFLYKVSNSIIFIIFNNILITKY